MYNLCRSIEFRIPHDEPRGTRVLVFYVCTTHLSSSKLTRTRPTSQRCSHGLLCIFLEGDAAPVPVHMLSRQEACCVQITRVYWYCCCCCGWCVPCPSLSPPGVSPFKKEFKRMKTSGVSPRTVSDGYRQSVTHVVMVLFYILPDSCTG